MDQIKILKFGGSSIADADCIRRVGKIIKSQLDDCRAAIVVSAFGGVTNKLSKLAENIEYGFNVQEKSLELKTHHDSVCSALNLEKLDISIDIWEEFEDCLDSWKKYNDAEFKDEILSFGERASGTILANFLTQIGIPSTVFDARKAILTDDHFGNAFVHYQQTYKRIRHEFKETNNVEVITGFIGATEDGRTTTLGRSGSDYTASIFGAALNAEEIQIWTDVDGILTADPNSVKQAESISHLNYEEAMELAHGGAKVIFPPTMIPALYKNIPIRIKNTFNASHKGTLITNQRKETDNPAVGISSRSGVCIIRLQGAGMVGLFGLIGRTFTSLASKKINIILVSQVFSEHSVCFVINADHAEKAESLLKKEFDIELNNHVIDKIIVEQNLSLIALVGEGMRHIPGISGKLFNALGREKINVVAIAQGSSERNISFVVDDNAAPKTMRVLHHEFFEKTENKTALILAGVGIVGSELLQILGKKNNPNLQLTGITTSKYMVIDSNGLHAENAKLILKKEHLIANITAVLKSAENYSQKIFIDCTSSDKIVDHYKEILSSGFSIVAANKKANTREMIFYKNIREKASADDVQFNYETNVGAGLPVISTIQSLMESGDNIHKIEGVLSGTLSYLFNNFDGTESFSKLVKSAMEKGYTEPDPREDLDGMDVARKCLILSRQMGNEMELDEIEVESLLPENSENCNTIEEFLNHLSNFDNQFSKKLKDANKNQKKLCYIGMIKNGNAIVSLKAVNRNHPFYHLEGSENIVSITTDRYLDQPLVIKGHGAGAAVTAGGVMADIMDIVEKTNE